MTNIWRMVGICAATAALAACGGGDDPPNGGDGSTGTDSTIPVSGSFAQCAAIGAPGALASQRLTLTFNASGATLVETLHVGTACNPAATFAQINYPPYGITNGGTQSVNGPNGGTATARRAIFTSPAQNVTYTLSPGIVGGVSNGNLIIQDANSPTVLVNMPVAQAAASEKDVFIRYNGNLYFGGDTLNSDQYPTAIDYASGWAAL